MRFSLPALFLPALLLFAAAPAFAAENGSTPDRITGPILPAARVPANTVHPLATPKADIGRVAPDQIFHRMVLMLSGSDAQKAALTQLLAGQQDPKSPSYHKWLTPSEFGERFGPSLHDIDAVVAWLTQQGFQVEAPSNGRQFLLFTGSSRQLESAFQTEIHQYNVSGKTHLANSKPASIPAALAGVVRGMASLNSFAQAKPQLFQAKKPQALNVGSYVFIEPSDISTIYNATPLKTANVLGQGQSIALIEESNINPLDFSDFRTLTGLPAGTLNVIVNGPDPGLLPGEETESILDASWAGALAPAATVNVIVTATTEFNQGIGLSLIYAVDFLVSPITSLSYGGCETLNNLFVSGSSFYGQIYQQGAAEGISHFVSSGDYGGDSCYQQFPNAGFGVNALGSSPWNVSVGGTEFVDPSLPVYFPPPAYNATGYIPERAWNDYQEYFAPYAGTGGVSIDYAKPPWQTGPGVPSDNARDVPDVSLLAGFHEPYLTCQRDIGADCSKKLAAGFIGTSIAAPNWAGIQALVNQKNAAIGGSGNPNPTYYRLAAAANSPFHDITVGDNKIPDYNGILAGYSTTPGYDLATGLGTVDINALASAWSAPTGPATAAVTLTSTATHITHGAPLTTNVTVVPSTGTSIPTGDVALLAGPQGVIQITLDNTGASTYAFGTGTGPNQLPGGSYNLTARYAGDAHFAPAVSNALPVTIDAEPSTTHETASQLSPIPYGSPVTLSAATYGNLSNFAAAGGTYTFRSGSTILGTAKAPVTGESFAPVAPVQANLTLTGTSALTVGTYSVIASFPGDPSFLTSASAPLPVKVVPGATLSSLLANHITPALNTVVTFTASTQSFHGYLVPITGNITFYDGATALGSVNLPTKYDPFGELIVTFPYTFTTPGLHSIIAKYSGDTNNLAGVSGIVDLTVGGKSSTTTSGFTPFFSLVGVSTPLYARVTGDSAGAAPTGTITFTDISTATPVILGTAQLTGNVASASVTTITQGLHSIVATYSGDALYSGSVSPARRLETGDFTITPATSATSVVAGQTSPGLTFNYAAPYNYNFYSPGITFSCSGLPAGATCNFSPSPLVPTTTVTTGGLTSATTGTTSLTISTTGPTLTRASLTQPATIGRRSGLLAMAAVLTLGLPLIWRKRRLLPSLLGVLVLATLAAAGGCSGGGGSSSSGQPVYTASGGTPAGASAVTVTATLNTGSLAGSLAHTVAVNLTVTAAGQ